jgi:hypothetical protein
MSALPAAVLSVPDDLAHIDAEERRWRACGFQNSATGLDLGLRCPLVLVDEAA